LRHRRSWAFEVLAASVVGGLLTGGAIGCGDDEPARDQAVLWMQLTPAQNRTCSSARTFSLPDDGARNVITGSGGGDRLVDGSAGSFVECRVAGAGASGQFNVSFNLSSGEIGSFSASGVVTMTSQTEGTGTFDIVFQTTSFTLRQDGCTATARAGLEGAVWLDGLNCSGLLDPSSPAIACTGTGGLIAENCAR
jgi:hypothetical protein